MKRSDLSSRLILSAVEAHGVNAWEILAGRYPPKIVLAAMQREVDAGNLDYGVALHRPWLTDKGRTEMAR